MAETLPSLEGRLDLSTWLQVAELEGWTCELTFESGSRLRFDDGTLVGADHASIRGADAVLALFVAPQGSAKTTSPTLEPDEGLRWDATTATLRGYRLVDEWTRLRAQVLAVAADASALGPMATLFDGARTVAEVVADSGVPVAKACDLVLVALKNGVLKTAAPPDEARAADALTPVSEDEFWGLLDAAHEFTRAKQLDQAELVLRRALRARPGDPMAEQNLRRIQRLRARA